MEFEGIIFDLDGTLIDSLEDLCDSMNHVLSMQGFETHPIDSYRHFVGDGIIKLTERALPRSARNSQTIQKTCAMMEEFYQNHCLIKTEIFPGISETLEKFEQKKIKMAILSNKPDFFTKEITSHFFQNRFFSPVWGACVQKPKKPDPTKTKEIACHWQISQEKIIFVGDSDVDMQTATNANMFPVGVSWGFRDEQELKRSGAAKIIDKPSQLLELWHL